MPDPMQEQQKELSLADKRMSLPEGIQKLLPEANLSYYERTSDMHCNKDVAGGSKFKELKNIMEVFDHVDSEKFLQRVNDRDDDRQDLISAGAAESAFLPAKKGPDAPAGLPEALYYKVDGIEGKLGIIQLKDLSDETRVLVMREKGLSKQGERGYTPASFTVISGKFEDLPETDFATVIIGRDPKEKPEDPDNLNEVWTIHPGAPVRPFMKDFDWSSGLKSPEETGEGEKQKVIVTSVGKLKESGLGDDDYVKIVPGEMDKALEKYEVEEV